MFGVLFIIGYGFIVSIKIKKHSFSEVLPAVYLSIVVFLYPFYIVNRLRWGRSIIILSFVILVMTSVYQFIKRDHYLRCIDFYSLAGYLIIILAIVFMTKGNYVWLWDSTRLWGAVPKALYYTERLQLGPNALVYPFMQSYPPGMPLLVYFIESFNSEFSEWQIYLTYGALVTSFLVPAIKNISKKNFVILPLLCISILLVPCMATSNGGDDSYFYNSLYIDSVLGALFGYGIYTLTENDNRDLFSSYRMMIILFSLSLLKESGILFAITLFIVFILLHYQKQSLKSINEILLFICAFLSVVLPWSTWRLILKSYDIHSGGIKHSISTEILGNLWEKIISSPSIVYKSRESALYISCSVFVVLILEFISLYWIAKRTKQYETKRLVLLISVILLSYFLFLLGCGLAYGASFPSFQRYTSTLTIALLIYIYNTAVNSYLSRFQLVSGHKFSIFYRILYFVSLVIMVDTLYLWEQTTDRANVFSYEPVKQQSDFIVKTICREENTERLDPRNNINLYLMYTGTPVDNCLEAQRLYLDLVGSGIRQMNNYVDMQIINWDVYDEDPSIIDVNKIVQSWDWDLREYYHYVYVFDIDDRTKELYFKETSVNLEKRHLYRIDKSKNEIIDIGFD